MKLSAPKTAWYRSIFWRTTRLSWGVVVITMIVFIVSIIPYQKSMRLNSLSSKAQIVTTSIDQVTSSAIVNEDFGAVIDHCLQVIKNPSVDYVVLTRHDGFSLVHDENGWRQASLGTTWKPEEALENTRPLTESIRINPLSNQSPVFHHSHKFIYSSIDWGWVHIGLNLDSYYADIKHTTQRTLFLAALFIFLGLASSAWLSHQLTRPIRELSAVAQSIQSGNLGARANIHTGDEMEMLAYSFNQMTIQLQTSSNEMRASLEHKELLLREIHHRVKNNLQVLTSLLRLQARQTNDPALEKFVTESQARIRAMSLIHEKLYQSNNLAEVDLSDYVQSLVHDLYRSFGANADLIHVEQDIEPIGLGIDTAIPCGLVISELVSNALKHAFPDQRKGTIHISFKALDNGHYFLKISDDGVGMDPTLMTAKSKSMGLRLVSMLVESQLQGRLDFSSVSGTTFAIQFQPIVYTART